MKPFFNWQHLKPIWNKKTMSVFNYSGPVEDLNSGGGPQAGAYLCRIIKAELRTSQKGAQYLNVELQDDKEFSIYASFFPFSPKDYPKKALADFLIACGFWNGSAVDIGEWSQLVTRQVMVLAQLDTYFKAGIEKKTRVAHSYYNANNFFSAKETATGATEATSFIKNKKYVENNPMKAKSNNSAPSNDGTEPF